MLSNDAEYIRARFGTKPPNAIARGTQDRALLGINGGNGRVVRDVFMAIDRVGVSAAATDDDYSDYG